MSNETNKNWMEETIKQDEIDKYLTNGEDFINDTLIEQQINEGAAPSKEYIKDIIQKSLSLERLSPQETSALINLSPDEKELWDEIFKAGKTIKETVYGRRIVTFAPLYLSNLCVNNCTYCGYRSSNDQITRKQLDQSELAAEIKALVNEGHKRLIMVYGEHPSSDVNYIADTLRTAYSVKEGNGEIRRVNVNAAPLSTADLKILKDVGIGTYQVFQETYHHETYKKLHPTGIKSNYRWRLYALHRALEAGADDVGIGALFGLHDWRFEIMGLLYHTIDLEDKFNGIGPHTISFPRLEPAVGTPFASNSPHLLDDDSFKRVVAILRLAVPYTGMILTCRETPEMRSDVLELGVTQLDFGSNIGIGEYSLAKEDHNKQQFILNDNRPLEEGIRWLAERGRITSFCTAGYRCGRTGEYFMDIAKHGKVHQLCMPNAILTFKEYLMDYASPETRKVGDSLIKKEVEKIENPELKKMIQESLVKIENGTRDIYV